MGLISKKYRQNVVCRYDKDVGVPYYSYHDFEGLKQETYSFINSKGMEIHYFYYYFDDYKKDKVIMYLPGIGPGHTAYLAEIAQLTKRGYKVLTLDYTGCGESKGDLLGSLYEPTIDVMDLLDYLKLNQQIILIGHSLGGFTSLNVACLRKDITKAVLISAFLCIEDLIRSSINIKFIVKAILRYERKTSGQYFNTDIINYLKTTDNQLLFIHSNDDPIVSYQTLDERLKEMNNKNIKVSCVKNRKHNPNYTDDAVMYLNEVFGKYNDLISKGTIKTDEDKVSYFKDISLSRLTNQDEDIFNEIMKFVEE